MFFLLIFVLFQEILYLCTVIIASINKHLFFCKDVFDVCLLAFKLSTIETYQKRKTAERLRDMSYTYSNTHGSLY